MEAMGFDNKFSLQLDRGSVNLNGTTAIETYMLLGVGQQWVIQQEASPGQIVSILRKSKINTIGAWSDWVEKGTVNRPLTQIEDMAMNIGSNIFVENIEISQLLWEWQIGTRQIGWGKATTKDCRRILRGGITEPSVLNKKWRSAYSARWWSKLLSKLWKSELPPKDKKWVWKVLQHGIPSLERIEKCRHGDGICKRCRHEIETAEYIFWGCHLAKSKWSNMRYVTEGLECQNQMTGSFLAALHRAFRGRNPAKPFLFIATLRGIWEERMLLAEWHGYV
ncbi:hypothetical protein R1sor_009919 [Riccia sorocarpa]|uniref:Reverse transcriptase zinc-binding domain-containing protein n=1 Tax=Riccia sorocarpa TaxID=122646 RepID=A0ABD3HWS3_9MARC